MSDKTEFLAEQPSQLGVGEKMLNSIERFFYGSAKQVIFWSLVSFFLLGIAPWISAVYYLTGVGLWLNKK